MSDDNRANRASPKVVRFEQNSRSRLYRSIFQSQEAQPSGQACLQPLAAKNWPPLMTLIPWILQIPCG